MDAITKAQAKHEKKLFKKANVVSVGRGFKYVDGKRTDQMCIVVGVEAKVAASELKKKDLVPKTVSNIKTDVIKVGRVVAQTSKRKKKLRAMLAAAATDPTQKFRPAMPGVSIGHFATTAGTFGTVVKKNGQRMMLSNNHVIANSNGAQVGDAVYQPGPIDGGTSADQLATLEDWIPINFTSNGGGGGGTCGIAKATAWVANLFARVIRAEHRLVAIRSTDNEVDAAIAKPLNDADIIDDVLEIGTPVGVAEPEVGLPIQKYGRTTQYTNDTIRVVNATVMVDYDGRTGRFVNQFMAGNMSAGGDSGSGCFDMNNNLVGLLFAGSSEVTFFNPISKVFELLEIGL